MATIVLSGIRLDSEQDPQLQPERRPHEPVPMPPYQRGNIAVDLQSDDDISGYGQPLTQKAAQEMIKGFRGDGNDLRTVIEEMEEPTEKFLDPVNALTEEEKTKLLRSFLDLPDRQTTFGRETLLLLLSQKGCEGIRFYFCRNHRNHLSLVLVGVKSKNGNGKEPQDIGTSGSIMDLETLSDHVMIFEVGVPDGSSLTPPGNGMTAYTDTHQSAPSGNGK